QWTGTLGRTQERGARSRNQQGSYLDSKKTKPAGRGPAGSEPETGNVCDGSTSQHEPGPAAGSCLMSDRLAGDPFDVGAVDAEIAELTGVETVQFAHGLVVHAPVTVSADRVHGSPPDGVFVSMLHR